MRSLIAIAVLIASVCSFLGVFERVFASLYLTWKFGFERVEPVYLVSHSFWLFALIFGVLALITALLFLVWGCAGRSGDDYTHWLRYAQTLQFATLCLLLVMFGRRFFVLS